MKCRCELITVLQVCDLSGTSATLSMLGSDTVGQLKQQLETELEVPLAKQRLVHSGEELADSERTLQQCNVQDGDTLVLGRVRRNPTS